LATKKTEAAKASPEERLTGVAEHTLKIFAEVATKAAAELGEDPPDAGTVFAAVNTLTADRAVRNLHNVNDARSRELYALSTEPAIARIVAETESGETKTIFFANGTPTQKPGDGSLVASYRSPIGRLAALSVGKQFPSFSWGDLKVRERATLRPRLTDIGWDSVDSVVEGLKAGAVTVKSFRELLRSTGDDRGVDLLDAMLAEDRAASNVIEGQRRSVIAKMTLREQPLLDEYQDEIFRLPIDTRLVILGPPGTGKTTTLIKRLGLKLDVQYLNDEERDLVRQSVAGDAGHNQSWLMFTPSDLLKQYVKEAFAREGVPASDYRIQTWTDFRRDLARQRFGVLRTGMGTGTFILRPGLGRVQPATLPRQTQWFDDFDTWQAKVFWDDLRASANALAGHSDVGVARVGSRLKEALEASGAPGGPAFVSISEIENDVQALSASLRAETDAKIRRAISRELAQDNTLLARLADFLPTLSDDGDDGDDVETEDDEEAPRPRLGREAAFEAYAKVIRAQARAVVSGRTLNRQSRNGRIAEWLGERRLELEDLRSFGASLQIQASARRFVNPLRRYFGTLPSRYRRFRRERQADGHWYVKEGTGHSELSALEVDVILLAVLRGMRSLLADRRIGREFAEGRHSTLKTMRDLFRNQICVDEATDFSPIQLACMAAMCDPATQSFVACGDYNQRITEWGSRSDVDLRWVLPDVDLRPVSITYRHSRQLNELARSIVLLSTPDAPEAQLPQRVDNEGVNPVLACNMSNREEIASWLALRIGEIQRFSDEPPSIAVLVVEEEDVIPLADCLTAALAATHIRAVACSRGNLAGQDTDVRVFDVQHIKGLEFEAVFFIGLDQLAAREPELFDKFLYVGTTRAAMFLGLVTADRTLPARIESLRECFGADWLVNRREQTLAERPEPAICRATHP
jgi:hypothetical protein